MVRVHSHILRMQELHLHIKQGVHSHIVFHILRMRDNLISQMRGLRSPITQERLSPITQERLSHITQGILQMQGILRMLNNHLQPKFVHHLHINIESQVNIRSALVVAVVVALLLELRFGWQITHIPILKML